MPDRGPDTRRGWPAGVGAAALRQPRPGAVAGVAVAIAAVALATFAIYLLRTIAPVVALSVVYIPAVLLISTYWGLALGLLSSLLSAAAFNFFHLPPTGTFTIFSGRNWVALGAFTIVAVVASTIAELARSRALEAEGRRAEADLAAALARELLLGVDTSTALSGAARRVADGLGLASASIEQGAVEPGPRGLALALRGADGMPVATLVVPPGLTPEAEQRLRAKVVPTLEALVAIADRRDALQAERVETAALRRSDELKTALLRAVSHDLRTPLTAIVAAGHALGAGSLTDEERAELSAAVVEEGTRLAGLVDNLLALSRLQ
ncbi:MAG: sensor histidine kinase, partial [Solirubrobacteraceae bacterium]